MKLEQGKKYNTIHGELTYCGKFNHFIRYNLICDRCRKARDTIYEFCANWEQYQQGYVGEWYHYGSECIKHILIPEGLALTEAKRNYLSCDL